MTEEGRARRDQQARAAQEARQRGLAGFPQRAADYEQRIQAARTSLEGDRSALELLRLLDSVKVLARSISSEVSQYGLNLIPDDLAGERRRDMEQYAEIAQQHVEQAVRAPYMPEEIKGHLRMALAIDWFIVDLLSGETDRPA